MNELEEKVIEVLDKIKPYLQKDGGDVEFVKVEKDTVYVRVLGACVNCAMFEMTLKNGIELALTSEIPEIKKVINIE
ncbi:MAG: NifU family protein [Bacilli bacterium]